MKNKVILMALIVLLIGNVIYWASQKEGFHVDEMFSYEQVGNTKYPKPELDRPGEPCLNTWHNRAYYEDYLTISTDEAFDIQAFYASASRNTAHPPLYLTLLGIFISAFSPNHFTKWSGISFNIIFYLMTLLVYYDLSKQVLNQKTALISTFLCGICVGIVGEVIFIRDYMMLTFFSIALVDFHAYMLGQISTSRNTLKSRLPLYFILCGVLLSGALTHYYFVVFAFFVCFCYLLILLFAGEHRLIIEYTVSCVTGLLIYFGLWPSFFRDLFSGHRGIEALGNLSNSADEYGVQLAHLIKESDSRLLGGVGVILLAAATIILSVKWLRIHSFHYVFSGKRTIELFYSRPKAKDRGLEKRILGIEWPIILIVFVSSVLYFLLIAKIAPILLLDSYKDPRYIINVFPCYILVLVFFFSRIYLRIMGTHWQIITWVILAICVLLGYVSNGVDYLYRGANSQLEQLKQYSMYKAVFVSEFDFFCSNLNVYFAQTDAVYQTNKAGLSDIQKAFTGMDEEELLVYISIDSEDVYAVLDTLYTHLSAKSCKYLFDTVGRLTAQVFLLTL